MEDKGKMGNYSELISIIIPIYNSQNDLEACVNSVLSQTYSNFEVILVDDGSTDKSGHICDEYSKKDSRIITIHKENAGVSDARNKGIAKAKGEYLCFIDSDDIVTPYYLQTLYETIRKNNTDVVACDYYTFIDGDDVPQKAMQGKDEPIVITEKEMEDEDFSARYTIKLVVAFNKIYKRSVFDNISYPVGKIHEDAYVYHRILHVVQKIVYISDVLYFYRIRKGSITNSRFIPKELEDSMGAVLDRIDFYNEIGNQRLVNVAIDGYLYFLWRNIDLMKKDDISNYKKLIWPYILILREKIRLLKLSKDYSIKKLLKMYYIAYLKKDF